MQHDLLVVNLGHRRAIFSFLIYSHCDHSQSIMVHKSREANAFYIILIVSKMGFAAQQGTFLSRRDLRIGSILVLGCG